MCMNLPPKESMSLVLIDDYMIKLCLENNRSLTSRVLTKNPKSSGAFQSLSLYKFLFLLGGRPSCGAPAH